MNKKHLPAMLRLAITGLLAATVALTTLACRTMTVTTAPADRQALAAEAMTCADLFGPIAAATSQPAAEPAAHADAMLAYMDARAAVTDQRLDDATKFLRTAIKHDPTFVPALELLTKIYYDQRKTLRAKNAAEDLLHIAPTNIVGHFVLGNIFLADADRFEDGARNLYHVLLLADQQNQPRSETALLARWQLGQALATRGFLNAAVEVYEPLLNYIDQIDPAILERNQQIQQLATVYRPVLVLLLADFLCKLQRTEQAMAYYDQAQKYPSVAYRAALGKVRCLCQLNRKPQAIESLNALIQQGHIDDDLLDLYRSLFDKDTWIDKLLTVYAPTADNADVGRLLVEQLMQRQLYTQAATVLDKMLAADPDNAATVQLAIRAYGQLNRMDQCAALVVRSLIAGKHSGSVQLVQSSLSNRDTIAAFAKALDELKLPDDQNFARIYLQGLIAQIENRPADAAKNYRLAMQTAPTFLPAALSLSQLLLVQRQWQSAIDVVNGTLTKTKATGGLLYVKGQALAELDRPAEAIETLKAAAQLSPTSSRIALSLAEVYLQTNNADLALDAFKQAARNDFSGRDVLLEMVRTLIRADLRSIAQQVLDRYERRIGSDAEYQFLAAELAFEDSGDIKTYRATLETLRDRLTTPGLVDVAFAELEYGLGNHARAIQLVDRARVAQPALLPRDYQQAMEIKALSCWRVMDKDRAIATWQQLLRDWPNRYAFKLLLGSTYLDWLEYDKAQTIFADLLKSTRDDAKRFQIQQQLIATYVAQGNSAAATSLIDTWIAKAPDIDKTPLRQLLLGCALSAGNMTEVQNRLTALLVNDTAHLISWQRAQITFDLHQNRPQDALDRLDTWTASASDRNKQILNGLRIPVLIRLSRYDEAITLAQSLHASAKGPQRFAASLVVIQTMQAANRFQQAEAFINEQLASLTAGSPKSLDYRQRLVRTWQLAGQFDHAEDYVQSQIQSADDAARLEWRQVLVQLCNVRNQTADAVASLEQILRDAPDQIWVCNSLGYILADAGQQLDRAESLIRQALADEPNNYAYLDSMAWVMFRQGKLPQARQFATMALRQMMAPQRLAISIVGADNDALLGPDPVILDHLGDIEAAMDRIDQARVRWSQALWQARWMNPIDLETDLVERLTTKLRTTGELPEWLAPTTSQPTSQPTTAPTTRATSAPTSNPVSVSIRSSTTPPSSQPTTQPVR